MTIQGIILFRKDLRKMKLLLADLKSVINETATYDVFLNYEMQIQEKLKNS